MTPAQQAALTAVAGRELTQQEIDAIDLLLDPNNRNDTEIAAILSVGRVRVSPTEVGYGTIVGKLRGVGGGGGAFLDALAQVGQVDRDVFYTLKLIERGAFRIDLPESRAGMVALATAVPNLGPYVTALLALGEEPDPIPVADVSRALNVAEGRMNIS